MEENKLSEIQEEVKMIKEEAVEETVSKKNNKENIASLLSKLTTKQKITCSVVILLIYTLIVGVISASIQKQILANQIQKNFEEAFFVNDDSSDEVKKTTESEIKEEKEEKKDNQEIKDILLDETVKTENYKFTLNSVELSHDVKPSNPPSYYSHYPAPDGKVYIYVNAMVKNLSKKSIECDEIYSVVADYDNGYEYTGFNIANDSDGDFTYASITDIDPLETLGVHCLVECPIEIEKTKKPLFIIITLRDGSKYKYQIR